MYRQKSFFNRWKNKSLQGSPGQSGKPPNGFGSRRSVQPSSFRSYASRVNNIKEGPRKQSSIRDTIALKDADTMSAYSTPPRSRHSSRRNRDIGESELGGSRASWTSEHTVSTEGIYLPQNRKRSVVDNAVQTDEELLQSLFEGIRRRIRKPDADNSSKSGIEHTPDDEIVVITNRQTKLSALSNNLSPSYTNTDQQTTNYEACETDCLLSTDATLDHDTTEHVLLHVQERAPLLSASPEHTPFLSPRNGKLRRCDSTSEETLSENNEACLDDIEDLLTGVCPQEGSFGSLVVAELEPPLHPVTVNNSISQTQPSHDVMIAVVGCNQADMPEYVHISSPTKATKSIPTSQTLEWEQKKETEDCLTGSPLRSTRSAPVLAAGEATTPWPETVLTPYSAITLPQILVQNPTPMPSDTSSSTDPSSDGGQTCTESAVEEGRRYSSESQSSSAGHTSTVTSLDELEPFSLSTDSASSNREQQQRHNVPPQPENISKFQEYLKTRGLDLDLTSVPSSDV